MYSGLQVMADGVGVVGGTEAHRLPREWMTADSKPGHGPKKPIAPDCRAIEKLKKRKEANWRCSTARDGKIKTP
jgi:hypothetical protein